MCSPEDRLANRSVRPFERTGVDSHSGRRRRRAERGVTNERFRWVSTGCSLAALIIKIMSNEIERKRWNYCGRAARISVRSSSSSRRQRAKATEIILDTLSSLFTGLLPNGYNPPDTFCFDLYCADPPIMVSPLTCLAFSSFSSLASCACLNALFFLTDNNVWLLTHFLLNIYTPPNGFCFDLFCDDTPIMVVCFALFRLHREIVRNGKDSSLIRFSPSRTIHGCTTTMFRNVCERSFKQRRTRRTVLPPTTSS